MRVPPGLTIKKETLVAVVGRMTGSSTTVRRAFCYKAEFSQRL